jgi:hypothetical protein
VIVERKEYAMKKPQILLLTPLALVLPSLAFAWGNDCKVSEARQADADAGGATKVRVEAKAGELRIMGEEGLSEVQARGTACAKNEKTLAKVQLRAERSGDEIHVVAEVPDGWGDDGRLDMELRVPASLAVEVEDGSGEIEIDNVASLRLKDGSGEIEVTGVRGSVVVEDGSGSIEILDVAGDVIIENDGSGEIVVRGVGQDVRVERDGSGSIRVEDVGGSFTVDRDGSGSIEHAGVEGEVDIPRK